MLQQMLCKWKGFTGVKGKCLPPFVKVYYPKSAGRENWSSMFPCCLQKTRVGPISKYRVLIREASYPS